MVGNGDKTMSVNRFAVGRSVILNYAIAVSMKFPYCA